MITRLSFQSAQPLQMAQFSVGVNTDKAWLSEAARITLASSGARTPGVDGVDKRVMEAHLHDELATIRDELLAGSYSPLPARRVYIPKANGKLRPLGIPSLRDRIVQRAMLMVIEPIWESDFHPGLMALDRLAAYITRYAR